MTTIVRVTAVPTVYAADTIYFVQIAGGDLQVIVTGESASVIASSKVSGWTADVDALEAALATLDEREATNHAAQAATILSLAEEVANNSVEPLPTGTTISRDTRGRVSVISEMISGASKTTTIDYGANGSVNAIVTNKNGALRTETFEYTNGILTSISVEEG